MLSIALTGSQGGHMAGEEAAGWKDKVGEIIGGPKKQGHCRTM